MSEYRHRMARDEAADIAPFEASGEDAFGFGALGRPDGAPDAAAQVARPVTELLVQFRAGSSAADQALAVSNAGGVSASVIRSAADGDLLLVSVGPGNSADAVMNALARNPNVAFAEANSAISVQGSNDTRYASGGLWGMYGDTTTPVNQFGSQAGEAWAAGHTACNNVIVGVIDEGIYYTHEDLAANAGKNPGEIAGNGVDDDGNGYADDVNGWDFHDGDNNPNPTLSGVDGDRHANQNSRPVGHRCGPRSQ